MSSPESLVVTVRRTGGVGGIPRSWTVVEADLPSSAAAQLRRLVAAVSVGPAVRSTRQAPGQPDAFSHTVEVAVGGSTSLVSGGDGGAGEALVTFVRANANARP